MVYLIEGNEYYKDSEPLAYSETKSNAEKVLRKAGYKLNAETGLFLNDKTSKWANITPFENAETVFLGDNQTHQFSKGLGG